MHIATKPLKDYPWIARLFFWNQRRRYGQVLEPGMLWARSPLVFYALATLYGAFDRKRSPLSPVLRSLVTVRVSQINHCAFCIDINSATLIKRGVPDNKIEELWNWRESQLFDATERAALEYAEAVSQTGNEAITAELMGTLKQKFDADTLVELTGLIAFQNMSAKFNSALDVAPQGFCQLPTQIMEQS